MRHGRKSKTKAFNGYKRHVAVDLDTKLVLAVALRPANEPEREALAELWDQLCEQGQRISAVYMDRGYIGSDVIVEILDAGAEVVCKPWAQPNQGRSFAALAGKSVGSRLASRSVSTLRDARAARTARRVRPVSEGVD